MNLFLTLAFLFSIGATCGWVLELFYRHFASGPKGQRKWINPGFCTGPYLPIYGCGLCVLFLLAMLEGALPWMNKPVMFLFMAVAMTAIEYVAGLWCLKHTKVRLWDYRASSAPNSPCTGPSSERCTISSSIPGFWGPWTG